MTSPAHSAIDPAILYWGTPVVLITSENEDGSCNIGPMSSAWWLGRSCMLGLDGSSKTTQNILRTKQCVLNLPDDIMAAHVNELAGTTGTNPVPASKKKRGYASVQDKWAKAALTPAPADMVRPARIAECPVQMECELLQVVGLRPDRQHPSGPDLALEVQVLRVYVTDDLRMAGCPSRINPDKWRPLIMSFQELYGLKDGKVTHSVLGQVPEELYRGVPIDVVANKPGEDGNEDQLTHGSI